MGPALCRTHIGGSYSVVRLLINLVASLGVLFRVCTFPVSQVFFIWLEVFPFVVSLSLCCSFILVLSRSNTFAADQEPVVLVFFYTDQQVSATVAVVDVRCLQLQGLVRIVFSSHTFVHEGL